MSLPVYETYSAYYDLLYRDKDYLGEVNYVDRLIRRQLPDAKTLLDLGCGTGVHALLFAQRGYAVHGIDRSKAMLEIAETRAENSLPGANKPTFSVGALTDFNVSSRYDVVVSLFDVVGYLTDDTAVRAMLANVRSSLRHGGLFLFDCWYGPAVHNQKPGTTVRRIENQTISLLRLAESSFDVRRNRIDVSYDVFVTHKPDERITHIREAHSVRCFFEDELDGLLAPFGLKRSFAKAWFTEADPSPDTWSVLHGYVLEDGPP